MIFNELNEDNFLLFAIKNYQNPQAVTRDDFEKDLNHFRYIKRLLNRDKSTGELSERLILNHLIVIFNVFGYDAGLDILELKIELDHWTTLKPFLIFLKAIKNDMYTNIEMDKLVVERLRNI